MVDNQYIDERLYSGAFEFATAWSISLRGLLFGDYFSYLALEGGGVCDCGLFAGLNLACISSIAC
jgi:hypothetical protein